MITVIAGVNGAGKSSITGKALRKEGGEYFNPDEVARQLMNEDSSLTQNNANAKAWNMGYGQLNDAISQNLDYNFETTLGGNSITKCLLNAIQHGIQVRVFYCGLASVDLHIERVKSRVLQGGHDIPKEKIHERFTTSMHNMMRLLPGCYQVNVYDNSAPLTNGKPGIKRLFCIKEADIVIDETNMPDWAKPLAAEAIKVSQRNQT